MKLIDLHDIDTIGDAPKNNVSPVLIVVSNVYRQYSEPAFSAYYDVSDISWKFIRGRSRDIIPRLIEYCTHDS